MSSCSSSSASYSTSSNSSCSSSSEHVDGIASQFAHCRVMRMSLAVLQQLQLLQLQTGRSRRRPAALRISVDEAIEHANDRICVVP